MGGLDLRPGGDFLGGGEVGLVGDLAEDPFLHERDVLAGGDFGRVAVLVKPAVGVTVFWSLVSNCFRRDLGGEREKGMYPAADMVGQERGLQTGCPVLWSVSWITLIRPSKRRYCSTTGLAVSAPRCLLFTGLAGEGRCVP